MDLMEWVMSLMLGCCAAMVLALVGFLGGAAYFSIACYNSGSPDSMACYMAKGKTERIQADVTVKQ